MALLQSIWPGWLECSARSIAVFFGIYTGFVCVIAVTLAFTSIQLSNVSVLNPR